MIEKFKPKKGVEGTNTFKAPGRDKLNKIEETPGPQTYKSASLDPLPKQSGNGRPFIFNEKRFTSVDNEVPGAGSYNVADSIKVVDANKQSAVFKSKAEKTMDIVIGKDNPGIGQYNAYHQNTLANKEFQGGAAINFVLFTRQNYQVRSPEIKPMPRIGEMIVNSTPANVGPGKYLDPDKKDFVSMFKPKQGVSNL